MWPWKKKDTKDIPGDLETKLRFIKSNIKNPNSEDGKAVYYTILNVYSRLKALEELCATHNMGEKNRMQLRKVPGKIVGPITKTFERIKTMCDGPEEAAVKLHLVKTEAERGENRCQSLVSAIVKSQEEKE